jgi:hypothetical protein
MDRRSFLAVLLGASAFGILHETTQPARSMPAARLGDEPMSNTPAADEDARAPDGTSVDDAQYYRRYGRRHRRRRRRRRRVCWVYRDNWGRRRRRCRWVWRYGRW